MFTGIIEEKGTIQSIRQTGEAIVMRIKAPHILTDAKLGDSISVNGVCLTVTSFDDESFTVDIMPETVRATSLKLLSNGSSVNLERAMGANGRFGGHFVTGHVDGVGTIRSKRKEANAVYYEIEVNEHLRRHMMMKGSVAVDGTSLTIFGVDATSFLISIIPHTLEETIIGSKGPGDIVNIETDMLAKYMDQLLSRSQNTDKDASDKLTESFLKDHGF
ncbi:riboflavin synthase [Alteribacter aurantiacus]|uniref:riboflavin synthase n=1 Tax=Alteribacter aurantiacus TaxID=254410 RepID=UPI000407999D|nr:riboflavin synthase [Alteribacter aurantiacus]